MIEHEELICVLPSSRRLAHQPTVAVSDLVEESFLTCPANSRSARAPSVLKRARRRGSSLQ